MGRNLFGGNHKHHARIYSTSTRHFEPHPHGISACVSHVLGNATLRVITIDGILLQVVIRNKFKGKRKGNNLISVGSFISVGLYEWENPPKGGDVVEVYTSEDIQILLQNNTFSEFYNKMNRTLQIFNSNQSTTDTTIQAGFDLQFTNDVIKSNNIVVDNPMDLPEQTDHITNTSIDDSTLDSLDDEVDIDCI